jgi:hypothetical protein
MDSLQKSSNIYELAYAKLIELIANAKPNYGNIMLELIFHDGQCVRFTTRLERSYKT